MRLFTLNNQINTELRDHLLLHAHACVDVVDLAKLVPVVALAACAAVAKLDGPVLIVDRCSSPCCARGPRRRF